MTPPVKLLLIYVAETETWGQTPLYEAIIRRLRQLEVAGATASAGLMGFGSHKKSTTNVCSACPMTGP